MADFETFLNNNGLPQRGAVTALDGDTSRQDGEADLRLRGVLATETAKDFKGTVDQPGAVTAQVSFQRWLDANPGAERTTTGDKTYNREVGDYVAPSGETAGEYQIRTGQAFAARNAPRSHMYAQLRQNIAAATGDWSHLTPGEQELLRVNAEQWNMGPDGLQDAIIGGRQLSASTMPNGGEETRGEFRKGFDLGNSQTVQAWHGMGALFSEALGDEAGMEESLAQVQEEKDRFEGFGGPRVGALEDVKSVRDAFDYMAGGLGQGIASTLPTLAAGATTFGTGAVAANIAKKKAMDKAMAFAAERLATTAHGFAPLSVPLVQQAIRAEGGRKAMETLAKYKFGTKIATGAAAYAGSNIMESGAIYNELQERGLADWRTALGYGSVSAAADVAGLAFAVGRVLPAADDVAKDGIVKILTSGVMKDFIKSAGVEGSTEALQEVVHMAAILHEDPTFDMSGPDAHSRIMNAFALGALTGGVIGGTSRAVGNVGVAATRPPAAKPVTTPVTGAAATATATATAGAVPVTGATADPTAGVTPAAQAGEPNVVGAPPQPTTGAAPAARGDELNAVPRGAPTAKVTPPTAAVVVTEPPLSPQGTLDSAFPIDAEAHYSDSAERQDEKYSRATNWKPANTAAALPEGSTTSTYFDNQLVDRRGQPTSVLRDILQYGGESDVAAYRAENERRKAAGQPRRPFTLYRHPKLPGQVFTSRSSFVQALRKGGDTELNAVPRGAPPERVAAESAANEKFIAENGHNSEALLDHLAQTATRPEDRVLASQLQRIFKARGFHPALVTSDREDLEPEVRDKMDRVAAATYIDSHNEGKGVVLARSSTAVKTSGKGQVGTDTETLLHEYLHAAVARAYNRPVTALDRAASAQIKSVAEYLKRIPRPKNAPEALWNHVTGKNAGDELISIVMTSPEFRKVLSDIKMPSGETAWQRFVSAVLKALGINAKSDRTAASEVEAAVRHYLEVSDTPRRPGIEPLMGERFMVGEEAKPIDDLLAKADARLAQAKGFAGAKPGSFGIIIDAPRRVTKRPNGGVDRVLPINARWLPADEHYAAAVQEILATHPDATARVVRLPADARQRDLAMRQRSNLATEPVALSTLADAVPAPTRTTTAGEEVDPDIADAMNADTVFDNEVFNPDDAAEVDDEPTLAGVENEDDTVDTPGAVEETFAQHERDNADTDAQLVGEEKQARRRAATLADKKIGIPRLLERAREINVAENPELFINLRAPTAVERDGQLVATEGRTIPLFVPDLQRLGRALRENITGTLAKGAEAADNGHIDVLIALEVLSEPSMWPRRPATPADLGVWPVLEMFTVRDGKYVDAAGEPVMVTEPLRTTHFVTEKGQKAQRELYFLPLDRGNAAFWEALQDKVVRQDSGKTFGELAGSKGDGTAARQRGDEDSFAGFVNARSHAERMVATIAEQAQAAASTEAGAAIKAVADQVARVLDGYINAGEAAAAARRTAENKLQDKAAVKAAGSQVYAERREQVDKLIARAERMVAAFHARFPAASAEERAAINHLATAPKAVADVLKQADAYAAAEVARRLNVGKRAGGKPSDATVKAARSDVFKAFYRGYAEVRASLIPEPLAAATHFIPDTVAGPVGPVVRARTGFDALADKEASITEDLERRQANKVGQETRASQAGEFIQYDLDRLKEIYGDDVDPDNIEAKVEPETKDAAGLPIQYDKHSSEFTDKIKQRVKAVNPQKSVPTVSPGIAALNFSDSLISTLLSMSEAVPVYGQVHLQTTKELVQDLVRRMSILTRAVNTAGASVEAKKSLLRERAWVSETLNKLQVDGKAGVVLLDPHTNTIHIALGDMALADEQGGLIALGHEFGHVVERMMLNPYMNVLPMKDGLIDTHALRIQFNRYSKIDGNDKNLAGWMRETYGVDRPTANVIAGFMDNVTGEPFHEWMATQWLRYVARTRLNTAEQKSPGVPSYTIEFLTNMAKRLAGVAKVIAERLGIKFGGKLQSFTRDYFSALVYAHTGMTAVTAGHTYAPLQFALENDAIVVRPFALREFGPMYMTRDEAWAEVGTDAKEFFARNVASRKMYQAANSRLSPFMRKTLVTAREGLAKIVMWNTAYMKSMKNLTPKLKAIIDIFDSGELHQFWTARRTKFWGQYLQATHGLNNEQKQELYKLLLARTNFDKATIADPAVKAAGQAVKTMTREMYVDAAEIIAAAGGKGFLETEFRYDADYGIQRVWNQEAILANESGFVEMLKANGVDGQAAMAFLGKVRAGMLMEGQGEQLELNMDIKPGTAGTMRGRELPPTMKGVEPFLNPSMDDVMRTYISQMTKTAALARYFGGTHTFKSGETAFWPTAKINFALNEARMSGMAKGQFSVPMDEKDLTYMATKAFPALLGRLGSDISPEARKFITTTQAFLNLLLLPFSTLASFPDMAGLLIRSRDLQMTSAAFREYLAGMNRDEIRETAELLGFVTSEALDEFMSTMYNDGLHDTSWAGKMNHALFKWNQQQRYTKFVRTVATSVAKKWLRQQYEAARAGDEKALDLLREVLPYTTSTTRVQDAALKMTVPQLLAVMDVWAAHDFNLVALNRAATSDKLQDGGTVDAAVRNADRVMQDVFAIFVNQAVLNPHAAERPVWASDPKWALVFHLKQFMYSFHKVILTRLAGDFAKAYANKDLGYAAHTASYLIPLLGLAAAGLVIRNLLQYSLVGDEPPEERTMDGGWAYIQQILQRSGIYGLAQFAMDVDRQAEQGGFWPAALLGPAASKVNDFVTAAAVEDDKWSQGVTNEVAKLFPPFSWSPPLRQNTLDSME